MRGYGFPITRNCHYLNLSSGKRNSNTLNNYLKLWLDNANIKCFINGKNKQIW